MKRIVFKVGSSVLADATSIAKERMLNLVSLIVEARKGYSCVIRGSRCRIYSSTIKQKCSYK